MVLDPGAVTHAGRGRRHEREWGMELVLPSLTVIDRTVPYGLEVVKIPIFEEEVRPDVIRFDLLQMQDHRARTSAVRHRARDRAQDEDAQDQDAQDRDAQDRPPDRILLVEVGSRFLAAPGDPSPFFRRDVGPVNCGALTGTAAVYCAVMARR